MNERILRDGVFQKGDRVTITRSEAGRDQETGKFYCGLGGVVTQVNGGYVMVKADGFSHSGEYYTNELVHEGNKWWGSRLSADELYKRLTKIHKKMNPYRYNDDGEYILRA